MPADQRRASIIAATRPLLAEHGLGFTTRQVAEATGIAEGTIFRHFASKDELISAVIADSLDVDSLSADLRAIDLELPLTDRVAEAMTVLRSSFTSIHELTAALKTRPQHTCVMRGQDKEGFSHPNHDMMATWTREITTQIVRLLEPDEERLCVDLDVAAQLVLAVSHIGLHRFDPTSVTFSATQLTDVVLHGVVRHPEPMEQEPSCS